MPQRAHLTRRHPRQPEPRPAPVLCEADALRLFHLAAASPTEHETIAFFLDRCGVGSVITVVSGTSDPDALLPIVECLSRAAALEPLDLSLVIASMRPHDGVLPSDIGRWFALCDIAADHDVHVLDWFVISPQGAQSPRSLCNEPDRWHLLAGAPRPAE